MSKLVTFTTPVDFMVEKSGMERADSGNIKTSPPNPGRPWPHFNSLDPVFAPSPSGEPAPGTDGAEVGVPSADAGGMLCIGLPSAAGVGRGFVAGLLASPLKPLLLQPTHTVARNGAVMTAAVTEPRDLILSVFIDKLFLHNMHFRCLRQNGRQA